MTSEQVEPLRVLVTGSTGYVGSRLVPALLQQGHTVVAASRSKDRVAAFPWGDQVEVAEFDIADGDVVTRAVAGVDAVVYLVHSMQDDNFAARDRAAAERVAAACAAAGVERLIYLSGLIPSVDEDQLSEHLRSRLEVEQVFLDGVVPATVLRAAMVIGAGSTSFELLRRLSERVPLLTPVPSWMRSRLQPVSIEDVVYVLGRALRGTPHNRHYDLGGDEVLRYPELLALYAEVAGLRRRRLLVPWVPTALVGRACAVISGLPRATVSALVESLSHEMVCQEDAVRRDVCEPGYEFTTVADALHRSLQPHGAGTSQEGDVQASAETDPA